MSESIGRLSREARLLFIGLWSSCDDYGRTRAASRFLASLLYAYDEDAVSKIDTWLGELVANRMVRLYEHDGSRYLDIPKWFEHQKIDRPTASKLPAFDASSRGLASPREPSCEEQGTGNRDQGTGNKGEYGAQSAPGLVEKTQSLAPGAAKPARFVKPSQEDLELHAARIGLPGSEVVKFQSFYEANGWRVGRNPMKNWRAAMTHWRTNYEERRNGFGHGLGGPQRRTEADRRRDACDPDKNGARPNTEDGEDCQPLS